MDTSYEESPTCEESPTTTSSPIERELQTALEKLQNESATRRKLQEQNRALQRQLTAVECFLDRVRDDKALIHRCKSVKKRSFATFFDGLDANRKRILNERKGDRFSLQRNLVLGWDSLHRQARGVALCKLGAEYSRRVGVEVAWRSLRYQRVVVAIRQRRECLVKGCVLLREWRATGAAWCQWRSASRVPVETSLEVRLLGLVRDAGWSKLLKPESRLRRWRLEYEWLWLGVLAGRLGEQLPDAEIKSLQETMKKLRDEPETETSSYAAFFQADQEGSRSLKEALQVSAQLNKWGVGEHRIKNPSVGSTNEAPQAGMKRWRAAEVVAAVSRTLKRLGHDDIAGAVEECHAAFGGAGAPASKPPARAR